MLWVIVERVVNLATLLLLVVMLSIIFTNNKSSEDLTRIDLKMEQYREERIKTINNNVTYFDGRINKLAENQDSYQVTTDRRLRLLEIAVKAFMDDAKVGQKIVNTNTNLNNNIINK